MKLFILRHGIAVDHGTPGYASDSERPLTPGGRRKTRVIARRLARLGVKPDVILTSPLVRARQTAEIVATELRLKKRLQLCEPLASGGDPRQIVAHMNRCHPEADSVMLVGHEPDLSAFASWLLTGSTSGAPMELKKGGVCVLEANRLKAGRCATLLWLAPPKLMTA